jgi:hypothetical protein
MNYVAPTMASPADGSWVTSSAHSGRGATAVARITERTQTIDTADELGPAHRRSKRTPEQTSSRDG